MIEKKTYFTETLTRCFLFLMIASQTYAIDSLKLKKQHYLANQILLHDSLFFAQQVEKGSQQFQAQIAQNKWNDANGLSENNWYILGDYDNLEILGEEMMVNNSFVSDKFFENLNKKLQDFHETYGIPFYIHISAFRLPLAEDYARIEIKDSDAEFRISEDGKLIRDTDADPFDYKTTYEELNRLAYPMTDEQAAVFSSRLGYEIWRKGNIEQNTLFASLDIYLDLLNSNDPNPDERYQNYYYNFYKPREVFIDYDDFSSHFEVFEESPREGYTALESDLLNFLEAADKALLQSISDMIAEDVHDWKNPTAFFGFLEVPWEEWLSFFEDDTEYLVYLAPSGKIIHLPVGAKPHFGSSNQNVHPGSLTAFELEGITYRAHYNGEMTEFLGFYSEIRNIIGMKKSYFYDLNDFGISTDARDPLPYQLANGVIATSTIRAAEGATRRITFVRISGTGAASILSLLTLRGDTPKEGSHYMGKGPIMSKDEFDNLITELENSLDVNMPDPDKEPEKALKWLLDKMFDGGLQALLPQEQELLRALLQSVLGNGYFNSQKDRGLFSYLQIINGSAKIVLDMLEKKEQNDNQKVIVYTATQGPADLNRPPNPNARDFDYDKFGGTYVTTNDIVNTQNYIKHCQKVIPPAIFGDWPTYITKIEISKKFLLKDPSIQSKSGEHPNAYWVYPFGHDAKVLEKYRVTEPNIGEYIMIPY